MYRRIGTISRFYLNGVYGKLLAEEKKHGLSEFYFANLKMTILSCGDCCPEKKYHFYSDKISKLEKKNTFTILYFPHHCIPGNSYPLDSKSQCTLGTKPNFLSHKYVSTHTKQVTEYTYIDNIRFSKHAKMNSEIFQKSKELFNRQYPSLTLSQIRYDYISSLDTYFTLWYFQAKTKKDSEELSVSLN